MRCCLSQIGPTVALPETWKYQWVYNVVCNTSDLKVDILEKTKIFVMKIITFVMKIRTFHVKISSFRENKNFSRKCEVYGLLDV